MLCGYIACKCIVCKLSHLQCHVLYTSYIRMFYSAIQIFYVETFNFHKTAETVKLFSFEIFHIGIIMIMLLHILHTAVRNDAIAL